LLKEELLGIFRELLKGGQEINFAHTARQAKSGDEDENRHSHNCEIKIIIGFNWQTGNLLRIQIDFQLY